MSASAVDSHALLADLYRQTCARRLPAATTWFDAHTHTGSNDPDGFTATPAQLIESLDRTGQSRALVFTSADPSGYGAANDRVLAEARASDGRLVALARVDPHAGALQEARRCLEAGAAGLKLHPRAERFTLSHPAVDEVVALAAERLMPVMIHAGRGIPALGRDAVTLARRHPGARLILAHAGVSDLSWLWDGVRALPNLYFDTAWWNVADLLMLFARVPPGQILYASDMPYGMPEFHGTALLRCAAAVGLGDEAVRAIAGGQLARILAREEPHDMGAAPGPPADPGAVAGPRVAQHLAGAVSRAFGGGDPTEPLALAGLACDVPVADPERANLERCAILIAAAEAAVPELPQSLRPVAWPAVMAALIAGTPSVAV